MNFPAEIPVLESTRLRLRPYTPADAPDLQRLAGDPAVAATTLTVPHPYPDGAAEEWIGRHAARWAAHEDLVLAITLKATGELLGTIGLAIQPAHEKAELGYWIGVPYWNRGYVSEAARAMLDCGFGMLGLNRIQAHHFAPNAASGRVMEKIGMRREGLCRQAVKKNGEFLDLVLFAVVRSEWSGGR